MNALDELSVQRFQRDGYLIVRGLAEASLVEQMRASILGALEPLQGPAEFEADVGYRGAPGSRSSKGGNTPRRLLNAFSRDAVFRHWATGDAVASRLRALMGTQHVRMSQCHHNCVMTKLPGYSSETMWHQDIRYWSFDRPELTSVWLALGSETRENGALLVIPGSHLLELDRGRLDRDLFLRQELDENQSLIDAAELVELEPGDTLFFHCRVFHAAGMNRATNTKLSAVFTYHDASNAPIPDTRSAVYPSIPV